MSSVYFCPGSLPPPPDPAAVPTVVMAIAEATTCTTLAALEMLDANSNSSRSRLDWRRRSAGTKPKASKGVQQRHVERHE